MHVTSILSIEVLSLSLDTDVRKNNCTCVFVDPAIFSQVGLLIGIWLLFILLVGGLFNLRMVRLPQGFFSKLASNETLEQVKLEISLYFMYGFIFFNDFFYGVFKNDRNSWKFVNLLLLLIFIIFYCNETLNLPYIPI